MAKPKIAINKKGIAAAVVFVGGALLVWLVTRKQSEPDTPKTDSAGTIPWPYGLPGQDSGPIGYTRGADGVFRLSATYTDHDHMAGSGCC